MSIYGNVPDSDIDAMRAAAFVTRVVTGHLRNDAPCEWRDATYELVLAGILKDWVTNGTNELDAGDIEDITNLMRVSADIAMEQDEALRDMAYRTLLKAAMRDWVDNWNMDE